ncbi:MAG: O-antigen ligase family protein [Ectothiorhodospiraceae bacterium]|nr:O-antigen ligase family protein [Ectothiorhodospiraceae bacterium]
MESFKIYDKAVKLSFQFKVITFLLIISSLSWGGTETVSDSVAVNVRQIIFRIAPVLIVIAYLFVLDSKRNLHAMKTLSRPIFWPVLLYLVFSVIGGSYGHYPLLAYWKTVEYFSVVYWAATLLSLTKNKQLTDIFRVVLISIVFIFVWMIIIASVYPSEGWFFEGSFKLNGVLPTINPNAIGFYCLYALVIAYHISKPIFRIIIVPFIFIFIIETSRSSYIAALVLLLLGVVTLVYKRPRKNYVVFLAMFTAVFSTLLSYFWVDVQLYILRGANDWSDLSNLSGRTSLWMIGVEELKRTFPFGNGIGTSSRYLYLNYDEIKQSVSMHNSPLELLINAGMGGVVMIIWYCGTGLSILISFLKSRRLMVHNDLVLMLYIILSTRFLSSSALASLQIELIIFFIVIIQHGRQKADEGLLRIGNSRRHEVC